jgi:hypothetical protein
LDIAKSVKRGVFGSADNLATGGSEEDKNVSGVGKSIFYDNTEYSNPSTAKIEEESLQQQQPTRPTDTTELRPNADLESSNRLSQQLIGDSEHTKKLLQELLAVKQQNNSLQRGFETLKVSHLTSLF